MTNNPLDITPMTRVLSKLAIKDMVAPEKTPSLLAGMVASSNRALQMQQQAAGMAGHTELDGE